VGDSVFHAESRRFTPNFQQKFRFRSLEKAILDLASDGAQLGWQATTITHDLSAQTGNSDD